MAKSHGDERKMVSFYGGKFFLIENKLYPARRITVQGKDGPMKVWGKGNPYYAEIRGDKVISKGGIVISSSDKVKGLA